ncbi:adenylosuccinate lyase [Candidatus Omnitrophota bacterium]
MIERYTLSKMGHIWEDESKFSKMLKIEVLVCEALAKLNKIPKQALEKIKKKARFDLETVQKLEEKTKHDIVAFLTNLADHLGPEARYLHLGLTSSDLLDTTLALQCKEAADILVDDCKKLLAVLAVKAKKYKETLCVARTHGVHAEPTTFGLKIAVWYDEMKRNIERLEHARTVIATGKISGAVGTYVHIDPRVEEYVCTKLGIASAAIGTQIVQRDIHAEFLTTLAIIGSSLDKFAMEIRHLQRTEVLEVEEGFYKGQIGSSAMPHKKNPITCERICGLARILRANSIVSLENIALWHERDISHSSAERITIPDSTIALDYMLNKFINVMEGLQVHTKNMIANLTKTKGAIYSQRILVELMNKGVPRTAAYDAIQRCALQTWQSTFEFKDLLSRDRKIRRYLSQDELDTCFNVKYYLKHVDKIFKKVGL